MFSRKDSQSTKKIFFDINKLTLRAFRALREILTFYEFIREFIGNFFDTSLSKESIASVHPEMALFHNLSVNLRDALCDVLQYVSA